MPAAFFSPDRLKIVPGTLRLAVCNELFEQTPLGQAKFQETCARVQRLGYSGLEIAPFTLAHDPVALTPEQRQDLRCAMLDAGLEFVGLHWLLAAPPGLHVTTSNQAVCTQSWSYVRQLVDLCADLAGPKTRRKGVMVFGSPRQRSTVDGVTPPEATSRFAHELARIAPHAEARGVTILIEALPANQSNVINSLEEAVGIVEQIDSPAVQTMFDTHNAVDEKEEHASLIRKYQAWIRHVHVNETDGREPGMGDYDFQSVLRALKEIGYSGWVSLEAFDFSRDADEVARRARLHLEAAASQIL